MRSEEGTAASENKSEEAQLASPVNTSRSPLLSAFFRVKLLDFGLARARDDTTNLTQSGVIIGTPTYMAPEQAKGEKVDGRADLFSLGCVLYQMLTAKKPFKGNDTISHLMALAIETPPWPADLNAEVSPAVSALTIRLLAKDAAERPASAQAVADALAALEAEAKDSTALRPAKGRGGHASFHGEQGDKEPRRRLRWLLALAVLGCLALLGGAIYFVVTNKSTDEAPIINVAANDPEQGWISLTEDGLKEWQQDGTDWNIVGDVRLSANDERKLIATPGSGILFSAADVDGPRNLVSRRRFEDMDLHAEFMVARRTNSGVFFQKHYELKIWDSFGDKKLHPGMCGGLFACEVNGTPNVTGAGATPRENASRPPGEWQTFDATYRAPRFDSAGNCVSPARFERVLHNGKLTHENAAVNSPTPKRHPDVLFLQGGWGPIAFRNIRVRPLAPYFDQLKRDDIPAHELQAAGNGDAAAAPRELVAVLGDSKLKYRGWVQNKSTLDGIAFSADGKQLLVVDEGANSTVWLRTWDADTGKPLTSHHVRSRPAGISPGGRLLALPGKNAVRVLQMSTAGFAAGKELYSTPPHDGDISWVAPMGWSQSSVALVAFSRDEKRIATGSLDKSVFLCDAESGKLLRKLDGFPFPLRSLDLSGDGARLVTACHDAINDKDVGEVKVWDASAGKEIASLTGHTHVVGRVALSPDGRHVVAAMMKIPWQWIWWEVQAPDRPRQLGISFGDVRFTPDSKRFFVCDTIYDTATGKAIFPISQGEGERGAWSPDSKRLATSAGFLRLAIYDAATGKPQLAPSATFGSIVSTAISRDGRLIASLTSQWGSHDVQVWSAATGRLLFTCAEKAIWNAELSFVPDGSRLAGISLDQKSILVWDTATGKLARSWTRDTGTWRAVAFSPDGRRLAGSTDREGTKIFDVESGVDICSFRGHQTAASSLAFSPDGRCIVSAASDNKGTHAKIWDTATGKETQSLPALGNQEARVVFSPDSQHVAVSTALLGCTVFDARTGKPVTTLPSKQGIAYSSDGALLAGLELSEEGLFCLSLRDARTGVLRRQWQLPGGISSVAFAPDGRHLVTGNSNGTLYVFRLQRLFSR